MFGLKICNTQNEEDEAVNEGFKSQDVKGLQNIGNNEQGIITRN